MRTLIPILALSIAIASPAGASDADEALKQGIELRKAGKDDAALAKFEQAWKLDPTPRARAQMALAEQALGRWAVAEQHMQEALASKDDAWIKAHRTQLEEAVAEIGKHLGTLDVRGGEGGAELFLDGAKIGSLPLAAPLRVAVGTFSLEVRHPGFYPVTRTIAVTAGGLTREEIEMRPIEAPKPAVAPPVVATPPKPTAVAPDAGPRVDRDEGATSRRVAWILAGTAAVAAGFGTYSLLHRNSVAAKYNDDKSCPGTAVLLQPPACDEHLQTVSRWETVSIVAFSTAGALAITSSVLFLTAPRGHAVALSISPSQSAMTWRFLW